MADERADGLAVWTGCLFDPLGDGDPFLVAAVEPSFVAHGRGLPGTGKITQRTGVKTWWEEAGSD